MGGSVSYPYEAIITVMALCVLITPTWKDQVVVELSHTHLYGLPFGTVTISPTQAGWFCSVVIRFVSGQGVWREATRSIMSGLSNSKVNRRAVWSCNVQNYPVLCSEKQSLLLAFASPNSSST